MLDHAVFRFMVASIKVRIGGNMYTNSLLCFCAALGIRRHPLGFTEAYLYTGMLAALLWVCRLFFLEAGFEDVPSELEQVSFEAADQFRQEHEQWMCVGKYTVIGKIINWMAYGKGHRNQTSGAPSVHWSDDGESLYHNGEQLRVQDFQRAACKLVQDADRLLDQLFGGTWGQVGPTIDLNKISDTVIRLGAGQSFATNEKNAWLDIGPGKIIRANSALLFDSVKCQWKRTNVRKWLQTFRKFLEILFVLVHIWGGMPGRGPETSTLRHCDTHQILRNIFIHNGQVMIITDRDKMKAIRDNGRKVARFLPERIGRMVIATIAWLQSAEHVLRRRCKLPEPPEKYYEFIWRSGSSSCWDTQKLSAIMIQQLQGDVKLRLGTGRYRTMAIELGRRIRGLVMKQVEGLAGEDDDGDGLEFDPMTGEPMDCKTTIIGSRIKLHLRRPPHILKLDDVKLAQAWASNLDIVWEAKDICDIPTPDEYGPAVDGLGPANTNGLRCELEPGCPFVGSEPKRMREHFRQTHKWDPNTKAGRRPTEPNTNVQDMPWRTGVRYQRLFMKGPRSDYFEVERDRTEVGDKSVDEEQRKLEILDALAALRKKTAHVRQQESEKIDEQYDIGPPNAWLRRLGAARHLKEFTGQKEFLLQLISLENKFEGGEPMNVDDRALRHIHAAVRRIVRQGRAVARAEVVSWNALFEVNRTDITKERTRPFHFLHMRVTRKAYTKVCMQLFTYLVRTMTFEDAKSRPPFVLSRRQNAAYLLECARAAST
ncbi:hypothetical protein S40288_10386 [Stachybotrys chartarum IBT 40288]|nr:hypothetical protein S40288_10386 [Stachybotrys chartarum IBT 40288]